MECISNYLGGDLISNALWRGVPLKDLLERAKLKPDVVVDIASFAWDGYSESMPLEMAMESGMFGSLHDERRASVLQTWLPRATHHPRAIRGEV